MAESAGIKHCGTITKTPIEVKDIHFDYAGDDLATGETMSSVDSSSVDPVGELVIDSTATSGTIVQATVSAGVSGSDYTVTVLGVTSNGQKLQADCTVSVRA